MNAEMLEEAVATYERPLIGYANSILHNVESARDVVQDTFLRLAQQDPEKVSAGMKSWLYTVCRNRSFDILRKQKRVHYTDEAEAYQVPSDDPSPRDAELSRELHEQALRYLERLTDNQREVILLKFQGGLSYREISAATGLSESNVGFLLHAGLKRLRQWMTEFAATS